MSGIVFLRTNTKTEIPPDRILSEAIGKLDVALLIGRDNDGQLYVAVSDADLQMNVFLANQFLHTVFRDFT